MKPSEVIALVGRMTLGYPFKAWDMGLRAFYAEATDSVDVAVFIDAPHRDTGKQGGGVHMVFQVPYVFSESMDENHLARFIRDRLHDMMAHEMDESILVDGKRIFDPHGTEKP